MRKSIQIAYFAIIAVCLIGGVAKTIAGDIYPAILSTSTAVWLALCYRDAKIVSKQEELINELLKVNQNIARRLEESRTRERIAQKVIADLRERNK